MSRRHSRAADPPGEDSPRATTFRGAGPVAVGAPFHRPRGPAAVRAFHVDPVPLYK